MSKIKEYTQYKNVTVVELCNGEWGVVDVAKRQVIVPPDFITQKTADVVLF